MQLNLLLQLALALASQGLAVPAQNPNELSTWLIKTKHVLPPIHSSQRCSFHKSPIVGAKQFIVEELHLENNYVHHVDLFRCAPPPGKTLKDMFDDFLSPEGYACDQQNIPAEYCTYYEWWSCPYPPPENRYPPNVGHAVEENEYLFMVTHYENPELLENVEVETGIKFTYSTHTKEFDAAFMQVGRYVSYKNLIPPNSKDFVVPHTCQSDCTQHLPHAINLFGITFHAHEFATQVKLIHLRKGKQLSVIAHDENYSPEEPFKFKKLEQEVRFLPEDELQVECTYDTTQAEGEAMIGGNTLHSEMCIAFVEYYPRSLTFSTCGTTLRASVVNAFFGIDAVDSEENVDPIITSPAKFKGHKFTEVVKSLNWTTAKRAEFQNIMSNGPRDAYCLPDRR